MFRDLFATDVPKLPTKKNTADKKKNEIPAKIISFLEIKDVFALSFTNKFFQTQTTAILANLSLSDIENKLAEQLNKISTLAIKLQTRKLFLFDLKFDEIDTDYARFREKLGLNQNKLDELFKERDRAYWFLASIPAAMTISFISHSIGFSLLTNLMITYQSLAGMGTVINYELPYIQIPIVEFLTSSALDQLHKSYTDLKFLCNAWSIARHQQQKGPSPNLVADRHCP